MDGATNIQMEPEIYIEGYKKPGPYYLNLSLHDLSGVHCTSLDLPRSSDCVGSHRLLQSTEPRDEYLRDKCLQLPVSPAPILRQTSPTLFPSQLIGLQDFAMAAIRFWYYDTTAD